MYVEEAVINTRMVVIGDTEVGKTSLMNRLILNKFSDNEVSTIGATHQLYLQEMDGTKLQIQIWDTAGQEKFKSLGPIYFRNSSGAIAVFDQSNERSFRSLPGWIKSFKEVAGENTIIAIAANKSDLTNGDDTLFVNASKWAAENGYLIESTSAKEGTGIMELFQRLSVELLKRQRTCRRQSFGREMDLSAAEPVKNSDCSC